MDSVTQRNNENIGNNISRCNISCTDDVLSLKDQEEIWTPDVIQRVTSTVIIMVITIIGNTVIITVLTCSKYRKRNTRVNIFIVNLAVGDLTVCFVTMTTEIIFVAFGEWILGWVGCKLLTYIQVVALSSTTFILTAMGFDRYMAICRPLRFAYSISRARRMILVSWILSFIISIPQLFIFVQTVDGYHDNHTVKYGCYSNGYTAEWQRKVYVTFMCFYILVFPSIMLSFCYINVARVVWKQGREDVYLNDSDTSLRRFIVNKSVISLAIMKTVKMTFCIILTFIACWTPYFVTTLCHIYSNRTLKIPRTVVAFSETMALLQSAVNPILYGIFNIKVFTGLREVFCSKQLKGRENSLAHYQTRKAFLCGSDSVEKRHANTVNEANYFSIQCQQNNSNISDSNNDSIEKSISLTGRSRGHCQCGCCITDSNNSSGKSHSRSQNGCGIVESTNTEGRSHSHCPNSCHFTESNKSKGKSYNNHQSGCVITESNRSLAKSHTHCPSGCLIAESNCSPARPQNHCPSGCLIAESDVHGIKFRVRFTAKDVIHVHDQHGRCLYQCGKKCDNDIIDDETECSV